jgi:Heavy metal associated domain 2
MTLPAAYLIHHTPNRMRLRIPSRRGQVPYFEQLVGGLAGLPGIDHIESNPVTGSIVLSPAIDVTPLAQHAERAGLFVLTTDADATTVPLATGLARGFQGLNSQIRTLSGDNLDLASVGFLALVGAAVVQLQRGHVLGPASTLLWYASGLLLMSRRSDRSSTNS